MSMCESGGACRYNRTTQSFIYCSCTSTQLARRLHTRCKRDQTTAVALRINVVLQRVDNDCRLVSNSDKITASQCVFECFVFIARAFPPILSHYAHNVMMLVLEVMRTVHIIFASLILNSDIFIANSKCIFFKYTILMCVWHCALLFVSQLLFVCLNVRSFCVFILQLKTWLLLHK